MAEPITPDELNSRGLVWFGGAGVAGVDLRLADGRVQRLELARPEHDEADDAATLTDMQREVLEVIDGLNAGAVVTNAEIAKKAGYGDANPSGHLREFVKLLAATGKLKRVSRGWQKV